MLNYKLTIEYDGTNYAGWQRQKNALAIQEIIEEALQKIYGHSVTIRGAGRTDAGVHAHGQVANFHTNDQRISPTALRKALNSILPKDIVIKKVENMPEKFHAQFSAKTKVYSYTILNRDYASAWQRHFVYFYPHTVNITRLRLGARVMRGRHNFASFAKKNPKLKSTVRSIKRLSVKRDGAHIRLTFEADGFLHKMVRIMVGTLLEISRGKISEATIQSYLKRSNGTPVGFTAPASGLCLEEVKY